MSDIEESKTDSGENLHSTSESVELEEIRNEEFRIEESLLDRAKRNERDAIEAMFRQFFPPEEEIYFAEYLGVEGLWGFGRHSFGCLTSQRVAALRVGFAGTVIFQDGLLEYTNSGAFYQPSKWQLYAYAIGAGILGLILTIATYGIGIVLVPVLLYLATRAYYRFHKCGAVWIIQEGLSVYVFADRGKVVRANELYRRVSKQRARVPSRG